MCHKAARLPRLALELSKHHEGGVEVVEGLLAREPELVTRAGQGQEVGEVGEVEEVELGPATDSLTSSATDSEGSLVASWTLVEREEAEQAGEIDQDKVRQI